ncbi:MAG: NAD(+)/NADH kinase [Firmicutes bacterium]|nr:NAD(+)/NADH kinase [Bacillota bacterium]
MNRYVNISYNDNALSVKTFKVMAEKLKKNGFTVTDEFDQNAELTVCIGGDGCFLDTVQTHSLPSMPIIGVNTGHLGFFQEITPDGIDDFITRYLNGKYVIQDLPAVMITCITDDQKVYTHYGINEVYVRGPHTKLLHLNLSIDDTYIERFSGDGILVATPAGSTAYNYSLGGSIVDPRINVLQVTPIAPMNTIAYRSFTSSLLLPSDLTISIIPEKRSDSSHLYIMFDGWEQQYDNIKELRISYSSNIVKLIRLDSYSFWNTVKTKFL